MDSAATTAFFLIRAHRVMLKATQFGHGRRREALLDEQVQRRLL